MAKHVQNTVVMFRGVDVSGMFARAILFRETGVADTVDLTAWVDRLEVEDQGRTLVIHLEVPGGVQE